MPLFQSRRWRHDGTIFSCALEIMKMKILFFFGCFFFGSCSVKKENNLQNFSELEVANYDTSLHKINGTWYYRKKLFSGYMLEKEKDGSIVYKLPIYEGEENGLAKGWYHSGEKLLEREFINGKINNHFIQWWPNGNQRYLFQYKNDLYHGTQYIFFPNGQKRQENNYLNGQEEGLQRVWNEKGLLISNYTIKNKKLYGIISVKSCLPVAH